MAKDVDPSLLLPVETPPPPRRGTWFRQHPTVWLLICLFGVAAFWAASVVIIASTLMKHEMKLWVMVVELCMTVGLALGFLSAKRMRASLPTVRRATVGQLIVVASSAVLFNRGRPHPSGSRSILWTASNVPAWLRLPAATIIIIGMAVFLLRFVLPVYRVRRSPASGMNGTSFFPGAIDSNQNPKQTRNRF